MRVVRQGAVADAEGMEHRRERTVAEASHDHDWAERRVLAAIGIGRIVWGVVTALASDRVHRIGHLDYPGPDQGVWIKAFGVRDVVLGAAALHADDAVRHATRRAGITMDLFDVGVVIHAARRGLPRRVAAIGVLLGGGTAVVAAVGPTMLRTLRPPSVRARGRIPRSIGRPAPPTGPPLKSSRLRMHR